MNKNKIALLLPAFNEELTIRDTIRAFHSEIPDLNIWVIDNCSTDNTYTISINTFTELNIAGGVLREFKKGKGNAVKKGFDEIDADIYLMVDADNTYPAAHVHELILGIKNGGDMVIGDRISNGSYRKVIERRFHRFGNGLVLKLVNYFFNSNLSDILSGYRSFSRKFVKNYPILVGGFELETDMTLFALHHKFNVSEITIGYGGRPQGSFSKLNTFSDGAKVLFTFLQIARYYRPMKWFAFASLLFVILGIISSIPVFIDWFEFQYIKHVPLAILATGLEITAFILFCIGLTLDSISYHDRQRLQQALINFKN